MHIMNEKKCIPSTVSHENQERLVKQLLELIGNQGSIIRQESEKLKNSKRKSPG